MNLKHILEATATIIGFPVIVFAAMVVGGCIWLMEGWTGIRRRNVTIIFPVGEPE
jgi:hypothetical protein